MTLKPVDTTIAAAAVLILSVPWTAPAAAQPQMPVASARPPMPEADRMRQSSTALSIRGEALLDMRRGDHEAAATKLLQALAVLEQIFEPGHATIEWTLGDLAAVYRRLERHGEAETIYLRLIALHDRAIERGGTAVVPYLNSLALLYVELDREEEAQARFLQAARILASFHETDRRLAAMSNRVIGPGSFRQYHVVSNNLAQSYARTGNYAEAERRFRNTAQWAEEMEEHDLALFTLTSLARLYERQNSPAEAGRTYDRALSALRATAAEGNRNILGSLVQIGAFYAQHGRAAEAEQLLREADAIAIRDLAPGHPDSVNAAYSWAEFLLNRPDRANLAVEPARRLRVAVQNRHALIGSQRARPAMLREIHSASMVFLDAVWSLGPERRAAADLLTEVFTASQDASLGEAGWAVAQASARRAATAADPLLESLLGERDRVADQLAANSTAISEMLGTPIGGAGLQILRDQRVALQGGLADVDRRISVAAPAFHDFASSTALDLSAVGAMLEPEEAILLLLPGPRGTHSIVVTADRMGWYRANLDHSLVAGGVDLLRRDVTVPPPAGSAPRFDRGLAHGLYRQLIQPLEPFLEGRTRLYVVAGGRLASLPPALLVTAPPTGSDDDPEALRRTAWLSDRFALVSVPSVRAFAMLRQRGQARPTDTGRFFGVGDPALEGPEQQRAIRTAPVALDPATLFAGGDQNRARGVASLNRLRQLPRLSGSRDELEAMARLFEGTTSRLLVGPNASERMLREEADLLANADVVMFATHGLLGGEVSEAAEPGLVLTPPTAREAADNGYLSASEVATLRLRADWVMLSACNTAMGHDIDAHGLGALSRAFLYAGARNLLVSHWPVSDEVAPILTVRTVALERSGVGRAESFQRAMREIRDDRSRDATGSWAHPYYWAPFVLIGSGR